MSYSLVARHLKTVVNRNLSKQVFKTSVAAMSGGDGSGSGKGGGSGGTIRDAGGSMGKREAAQENQYFRKQQAEQMAKLRKHVDDEVTTHQQLIKQHEEAIKKAKADLEELEKGSK